MAMNRRVNTPETVKADAIETPVMEAEVVAEAIAPEATTEPVAETVAPPTTGKYSFTVLTEAVPIANTRGIAPDPELVAAVAASFTSGKWVAVPSAQLYTSTNPNVAAKDLELKLAAVVRRAARSVAGEIGMHFRFDHNQGVTMFVARTPKKRA